MPGIHLDAAAPGIAFLILALLAGAAAFWQYRRTVPSVSTAKRSLLVLLRAVALFAMGLLLFEPSLRITSSSTELPTIAVLADNSASMQITDRSGLRSSTLDSLLRSRSMARLAERATLRYYSLGVVVRSFDPLSGDTLTFSDEATDLAAAIRSLGRVRSTDRLDAAILLSDGTYTLGPNPVYDAEEGALPLYTVALGDSADQKDLVLSRLLVNTTAYSGVESPVEVHVRATGFGGDRAQVRLMQGAEELTRTSLLLERGTRDYSVSLSFVPPEEVGVLRLTAEILPLPGELTAVNNRVSVSVRVLRNRLNILILAGAAGPDIAAVRQPLVEQENLAVTQFTQKGDGGYFEGRLTQEALDSANCLVFIGFPTSSLSSPHLDWIAQKLLLPSPLLFIAGRRIDYEKLKRLSSSLPFTADLPSTTEQLAVLLPSQLQRTHPLLMLNRPDTFSAWAKLPPVYQTLTVYHTRPDAILLASAEINGADTREPLMVTREGGGQRVIALLGYGLHRWRLMTHGDPLTSDLWTDFLTTAVRWLTTPTDISRLRVHPAKELFVRGEPVMFTGEAYDETLRPLDDARVSLMVTSGRATNEMELRPAGNGRYEGSIDALDEGEYSYRATAEAGGTTFGEVTGRFRVGEPGLEFRETRASPAVLRQLASRTGGMFFRQADFARLDSVIAASPLLQPRTVQRSRTVELWGWPGLLALALVLLAVEWTLRRRSGML